MLIRKLVSVIALAMAFLWFGTRTAHAAEVITWPDFNARLSGCDIVQVKLEHDQVNLAQIELVLESGPRAFHWKGIGVNAADGKYYEIGTAQATRDSMRLSAYDVMSAKSILLGKAKFAGVHEAAYEIHDLTNLQPGDRVTFTWIQDLCPDVRGYINPKQLPCWVPPATQMTMKFEVSAELAWYPDELLHIHFAQAMGVPAVKVDRVVTRRDKLLVTIDLVTPPNDGDVLGFKAWTNQAGGDSATLIDKDILVRKTDPGCGQQVTHVAPKLVTVPDLRGLSLTQARVTLKAVNLDVAVVDAPRPAVPETDQFVVRHDRGAGSQVPEHVKINVWTAAQSYVTPFGYSMLPLVNCSHVTNYLWEFTNDGWIQREEIPPMWTDNICPGFDVPRLARTLTHATWHYFTVVDPTRCKGNDPTDERCWAVTAFFILGDSNGGASSSVPN